jgi:ubiquinone/menaquinone biosynthesis C-methylase UbiE
MGQISDRRIPPIERLRAQAVQRLQLQPDSRVIDAGCGNGGSFPFLLKQIGPTGEVVGIEISHEMAERARLRIQKNGWHNISLVEDSALTAPLSGVFDALLLFAAHEISTSPEMLAHLLASLKAGGRVVAFSTRLTAPLLGWFTNPFFRMISKKWLPGSTPIDPQPWRTLAAQLDQVQVEMRLGGAMYLVSGIYKLYDGTRAS